MVNRTSRRALLVALLFGLSLAPAVIAQGPDMHTTYLTFSAPVRLPGVGLGAGTYVFETPVPGSGVVRVMSRDRKIAYFQGFTNAIERPRGFVQHDAAVSLGESARGTVPPINAWWPQGSSSGHAFIY